MNRHWIYTTFKLYFNECDIFFDQRSNYIITSYKCNIIIIFLFTSDLCADFTRMFYIANTPLICMCKSCWHLFLVLLKQMHTSLSGRGFHFNMPCQLHENKSVLSREASLHVTAFWKVLEWGRQIRIVVYLAVMLFVRKRCIDQKFWMS